MRTVKLAVIASLIATAVSFWFGQLGLMRKMWPQHPQWAAFFVCLVTCILVQVMWPKEWLGGPTKKN